MLTTNPFSVSFFDRHSIVDSVGGDQDRAADALLAMSDPDHVPAPHAAAVEQPSQVRHHNHTPSFLSILKLTNLLALHTPCKGRTNPSGRGVCAPAAARG
jgi:hypothetical protein